MAVFEISTYSDKGSWFIEVVVITDFRQINGWLLFFSIPFHIFLLKISFESILPNDLVNLHPWGHQSLPIIKAKQFIGFEQLLKREISVILTSNLRSN